MKHQKWNRINRSFKLGFERHAVDLSNPDTALEIKWPLWYKIKIFLRVVVKPLMVISAQWKLFALIDTLKEYGRLGEKLFTNVK